MNKKNKIILVLLAAYGNVAFSLTFENLTENSDEVVIKRKKIINSVDNDGVRLAWDGMKEMNKVHKPGNVDAAVKDFEVDMIKRLKKSSIKGIQIKKMDFKGYYITCQDRPACTGQLEKLIQKLPPGKIGNNVDFNLVSARANSFQEGYIKARVQSSYTGKKTGNYKETSYSDKKPLQKFIDTELRNAMAYAAGVSNVAEIDSSDPKFMANLKSVIEDTRAGKSVDPKLAHFKPLVKALDTLLETPFASSNNLEKSLAKAIDPSIKPVPPKKFLVTTAISGDDLFVVIKDARGDTVKVVGADARGLGVTNMTTRFDATLEHFKNGGKLSNLDDVLKLSKSAMKNADQNMEASIKKYVSFITESISSNTTNAGNINDALEGAHRNYHQTAVKDPALMTMRTTAISGCQQNQKCILNNVTIVHNLLKKLEARGKDGHFGDSCLSVQYWLMRAELGLK